MPHRFDRSMDSDFQGTDALPRDLRRLLQRETLNLDQFNRLALARRETRHGSTNSLLIVARLLFGFRAVAIKGFRDSNEI